jgi:tetratricopeptide (TPR) repeat protein
MSNKWEALKSKANAEYKEKNFKGAIDLYSDAISKTLIILGMDPHQDSLYSNRGLCYMNVKNYEKAIYDLEKAIKLNPSNIKAYKRLAYIKTILGDLIEAEIYLKRCIDNEPGIEEHKNDHKKIRDLIVAYDELKKAKFALDFRKTEVLAEKLLNNQVDATSVKIAYVEALLQNCKIDAAIYFIKDKLNDSERKMVEFLYFLSLAYYYEGK